MSDPGEGETRNQRQVDMGERFENPHIMRLDHERPAHPIIQAAAACGQGDLVAASKVPELTKQPVAMSREHAVAGCPRRWRVWKVRHSEAERLVVVGIQDDSRE